MNPIRRAALTTVTATALAIIGVSLAAGPANAKKGFYSPDYAVASASANVGSFQAVRPI